MNDPNKRIDVNISSLLSLKAELLRKQEEVNRVKSTKSIENFVPSKIPKPENIGNSSSKSVAQNQVNVMPEKSIEDTAEDIAMLAKSKRVLEQKSKFYERMAKAGGDLNSDENCLVMFNKKMQDTKIQQVSSDEESDSFDEGKEDYSSNNPDEDWVEYTDCFGRTRKCLRKDLEFMKRKDGNISNEVGTKPEEHEPPPAWIIDTEGQNSKNVSDSDEDSSDELLKMGIKEQMKKDWERKEIENVDKEFIHYQDVLFDEARTHGVGYYQFSTDDLERERQREELDKMRDATLDEQKKREEARKIREKIIAERVRAAKNRQRARQGLPPLEDVSLENKEEPLYDTTEEQERKAMEEQIKRKQEKEEKQRERSRKQYVRPWDKGKDNLKNPKNVDVSDDDDDGDDNEWEYKPEKILLNQQQWNDKKREERPKEFAPLYHSVKTQFSTPEQKPTSKSFFQRNKNIETPIEEDDYIENESKSLFFTTKKQPKPQTILRNNQLDDAEPNDRLPEGIEIPPPPTFEYYGPTSSKKARTQKPSRDQLESSIEAGLKFLREQSDKNASSGGKRVWTSKADY